MTNLQSGRLIFELGSINARASAAIGIGVSLSGRFTNLLSLIAMNQRTCLMESKTVLERSLNGRSWI